MIFTLTITLTLTLNLSNNKNLVYYDDIYTKPNPNSNPNSD